MKSTSIKSVYLRRHVRETCDFLKEVVQPTGNHGCNLADGLFWAHEIGGEILWVPLPKRVNDWETLPLRKTTFPLRTVGRLGKPSPCNVDQLTDGSCRFLASTGVTETETIPRTVVGVLVSGDRSLGMTTYAAVVVGR